MHSKLVFVCCLALAAHARSTSSSLNEIPQEQARSSGLSGMRMLQSAYQVYQECSAADLSSCLKLKLISAMDRVSRSASSISLFEGAAFVKEPTTNPEEPEKSEAEIEASLPRALSERDDSLNSLIVDKLFKFFESHTLQVKFPTASELQRSLTEESRGKKKKLGGLLMIPLILGGTLVPLALGALALLAGKALIVSKLALVLAGIIGLKKLLGGSQGGGHETAHEVHVSGGHGSGWGRSYEKEQQAAQNLAYSAYVPKSS